MAEWSRSPRLVVVALLITVSTVLFARAVTFEFLNFDDPLYVADNRRVQAGLTADNIRWAITTTEVANWHPLTWLSLELDTTLFGRSPAGYHATNVALHVANTVLLFLALSYMTGAVVRSGAVALLFAIHPLHVESVAWIAERKDVLSTLFWMATLWAYAYYARRPSWLRYVAVVVFFGLGLATKSMLVTLPCTLLLLDYWPLNRVASVTSTTAGVPSFNRASLKWLIVEKLTLAALSVACSIVTVIAQAQSGAVSSAEITPLAFRLMNACDAYLAYLWRAIWPLDLAIFYPHPLGKQVPVLAIIAAVLLAAATLWIFRRWRRQPYLAVGWCWFLGTLVPVIGFVQIGSQAIADRYTYVPLIGIFIAVVWGLADLVLSKRLSRRLVVALAAVAFVTFVVCTWRQLNYWENDVVLWQHAIDVTGPNQQAYDCLGEALLRRGFPEEALPYLSELAARAPDYDTGHANYGTALLGLGKYEEARDELNTALRLNPRNAMAHYNLGLVYRAEGENAKAIAKLKEALDIDRYLWKAHLALADIFERRGDTNEARRHIEQAEEIDLQAVRRFQARQAMVASQKGVDLAD